MKRLWFFFIFIFLSHSAFSKQLNHMTDSTSFLTATFSQDPAIKENNETQPKGEQITININIDLKNYFQEIGDYNEKFKTSIQNLEELQKDMTARITFFAEKLRSCTPGTYQYTMAGSTDLLYSTSVIQGKDGDRCIVDTTYSMGMLGNVLVKCQLTPQHLTFMADHFPEVALLNSADKDDSKTQPQTLKDDCKLSVTGFLKYINQQPAP